MKRISQRIIVRIIVGVVIILIFKAVSALAITSINANHPGTLNQVFKADLDVTINGSVPNGTYSISFTRGGTGTPSSNNYGPHNGTMTFSVTNNVPSGAVQNLTNDTVAVMCPFYDGQGYAYIKLGTVSGPAGSTATLSGENEYRAVRQGGGSGATYTQRIKVTLEGTPVEKTATLQLNWNNACYLATSAVLNYNGQTVSTVAMAANGTGQGSYTQQNAVAGDTWAWVVSGVTIASGTVAFTPEFPDAYGATSEFNDSCTQPTPTPSATPLEGPTPNPSATPLSNSPPPPGVGGPGGTVNSNVTVENVNDFYKPVLEALNQSGRDAPRITAANYGTIADGDFSDRGKLDAVTAVATEAGNSADQVSGKFSSLGEQMKTTFNTMQTQVTGKQWTIASGAGAFGFEPTIDLTPYAAQVNLLRSVILWLVMISFAILMTQALTYQGAGD